VKLRLCVQRKEHTRRFLFCDIAYAWCPETAMKGLRADFSIHYINTEILRSEITSDPTFLIKDSLILKYGNVQ
jgi:hypothetical protein